MTIFLIVNIEVQHKLTDSIETNHLSDCKVVISKFKLATNSHFCSDRNILNKKIVKNIKGTCKEVKTMLQISSNEARMWKKLFENTGKKWGNNSKT